MLDLAIEQLVALIKSLPLRDLVWSLLEPAEAPAGVKTTVVNSTVSVKWSKAQNVRGLLQGYKVPQKRQTLGDTSQTPTDCGKTTPPGGRS